VSDVQSHDESVSSVLAEGSYNQKTVAVTGANGFIGSHIVKDLLEKGYKVRGTVKHLDHEKVDFLTYLPRAAENLTLFKGELLDEGCFDNAFEGCDCVFHLASPTLKDQREMKNPETEMINQAVNGTINVLTSCKNTGVKCVVLTSSMCAATQKKPRLPDEVHEKHWADHEHMIKKGSYYAASKILKEKAALKFVSEMPKESAFRLVRICPSLTVGPMLQPYVNSSMDRFAAICHGTHHKQVPNRSISLIDVRDLAQHHIAAYEKGLEGRYLSTTEGWHWTTVYQVLKILRPQMICPKPLPKGTEIRRVREYSKTRMKDFGVKERSFYRTLRDASEEVDSQGLSGCTYQCSIFSADLVVFEPYCGFYKLGGDGTFFMIEVLANFAPNKNITYGVNFYYLLNLKDEFPTKVEVPAGSYPSLLNNGILDMPEIDTVLKFRRVELSAPWTVTGRIEGKDVGYPLGGNCAVPFDQFEGTYTGSDGNDVTIALSDTGSSITDYEGKTTETFIYNKLKRQFLYRVNHVKSRLYMNVEGGRGLRLTFVRFDPNHLPGSTKYFYLNNEPKRGPGGPVSGDISLSSFAGFYPLNSSGSFVSISLIAKPLTTPVVGVCTDDVHSTEYSSYTFKKNVLSIGDLSLTFVNLSGYPAKQVIVDSNNLTGTNFFYQAGLLKFGKRIFTGTNLDGDEYTLQIVDLRVLVFKKGDYEIFNTSDFEYYPLGQYATVLSDATNDAISRQLFFTYNGLRGETCAVTQMPGLEVVLYVIPSIPVE